MSKPLIILEVSFVSGVRWPLVLPQCDSFKKPFLSPLIHTITSFIYPFFSPTGKKFAPRTNLRAME